MTEFGLLIIAVVSALLGGVIGILGTKSLIRNNQRNQFQSITIRAESAETLNAKLAAKIQELGEQISCLEDILRATSKREHDLLSKKIASAPIKITDEENGKILPYEKSASDAIVARSWNPKDLFDTPKGNSSVVTQNNNQNNLSLKSMLDKNDPEDKKPAKSVVIEADTSFAAPQLNVKRAELSEEIRVRELKQFTERKVWREMNPNPEKPEKRESLKTIKKREQKKHNWKITKEPRDWHERKRYTKQPGP
jgi:hypothetical protein